MAIPDAAASLDADLRAIFGNRLQSLVVYGARDAGAAGRQTGAPIAALAIVASLTPDDLRDCAGHAAGWHDLGLATPLILETTEFARSLDAFPFEFGAILADHALVSGPDPFAGCRVNAADLRRACEVQARSHLLHLREAYIETRGRSDALADLIARSAVPLAALLENVGRLGITRHADALERVATLAGSAPSSEQARVLFPDYLAAVKQLTHDIDQWRA
jgi:hypothetical protein